MAAPFPHRYEVGFAWNGAGGGILSAEPRPPIHGGAPPEFDGSDLWWSPEHLLLSALSLCLMTTFFALAKKAGLAFSGYRGTAEGTLDKTKEGLVFTAFTVRVALTVPAAEAARGRQLLETAKKYCIVSNALKAPVALEAEVRTT